MKRLDLDAFADHAPPGQVGELLLSELIGALSHALDITEGQPKGHCVRCCWIGMHIGMEMGLSKRALWELYYTLLLKDLGCSSNAARICELYLTDIIAKAGVGVLIYIIAVRKSEIEYGAQARAAV